MLDDTKLKPGKIVSLKNNEETGITTIKLSNGATVVLRQTSFKNDEIVNKKSSHSFKNIYMKLKKRLKNNKIIQQVYLKNNTLTVFQK